MIMSDDDDDNDIALYDAHIDHNDYNDDDNDIALYDTHIDDNNDVSS